MNYVLNEYVHVRSETKWGDEWRVEYEPADTLPMRMPNGYAMSDKHEVLSTFHGHNRRLLIDAHHESPDLPKMTFGVFSEVSGAITIIWDKYPGEHFLCVSYESPDASVEIRMEPMNWKEEGF